jgi:hypothetical protein
MDVQALRTLVGYPHTPSRQLIEELDPRSPTLNDMNERFMPIAQDIDILTCFETLMTKSVAFDVSIRITTHVALFTVLKPWLGI